LRVADRLLQLRDAPDVMRDLQAADARVREAIRLIDTAAVIDKRDMDDNPPVDTYPDRGGRFRAIFQLLTAAKQDLTQQEQNLSAVGWRDAAVGQIDQAVALAKKAARDDWRDDMMRFGGGDSHPHYLHAISDLRFARALLWRRDEAIVMADQRMAIHEIEEAINEAHRAAIDDGKEMNFMPPVDARQRPVDRLNRALDALNSALRNLQFEEDNRAALGWRTAAIRDTNHAIELTRKAIRDDKVMDWFERFK
jgi:tetratricopeptide (TPR) repeat protein